MNAAWRRLLEGTKRGARGGDPGDCLGDAEGAFPGGSHRPYHETGRRDQQRGRQEARPALGKRPQG